MLLPWHCPASQEALEKKSVLRSPSLSNLGPAEWLPEERWREGSFCYQWGSDQRLYHRQSHVHHGVDFKKQTLQALKEIWKFAGRRWKCQVCVPTPGSGEYLGQRMCYTVYTCACLGNVMRMKIHQTLNIDCLCTCHHFQISIDKYLSIDNMDEN